MSAAISCGSAPLPSTNSLDQKISREMVLQAFRIADCAETMLAPLRKWFAISFKGASPLTERNPNFFLHLSSEAPTDLEASEAFFKACIREASRPPSSLIAKVLCANNRNVLEFVNSIRPNNQALVEACRHLEEPLRNGLESAPYLSSPSEVGVEKFLQNQPIFEQKPQLIICSSRKEDWFNKLPLQETIIFLLKLIESSDDSLLVYQCLSLDSAKSRFTTEEPFLTYDIESGKAAFEGRLQDDNEAE